MRLTLVSMDTALCRKVEKRLVRVGEHLRWTGGCDRYGMPVVRWQGRTLSVRRHLFLLENGLPTSALKVRQVCGDTKCVRPSHAEIGRSGPARKGVWERLGERVTAGAGGCLLVAADGADGEVSLVRWRGQPVRVARAVWEETNGPVPEGKVVAHSCRRSACVAREHLYLSTPEREIAVCADMGKFAGEAHWNHKLTDERVHFIRSSDLRPAELAAQYGVSRSAIVNVRARRSWTHL